MLSYLLATLESEEETQIFLKLYEKHHARMEKTALYILKNQHDAEDAVQNSFVQIIRYFEKIYQIPCQELPFWIIAIVKNEALQILRKKKNIVPLEDWTGFAEEAEQVSDYKGLVSLFTRLPETYRAALEMKLLLGYTAKEIARRLNISEDAVHARVSRGRALLREIAEKEGFHP